MPPGTTHPDGRVVSVEEFDCGGDPERPATRARAVVEVLEAEGAGHFQQIELDAVVVANGVEGAPGARTGRRTGSTTTPAAPR